MTTFHSPGGEASILEELDRDELPEEAVDYFRSDFDSRNLPEAPVLPREDEPHTGDWRRFLEETSGDPFAHVQEVLEQLKFPVRRGISETEAYANVARRGEPFEEQELDGRLTLESPGTFETRVVDHPVGSLPVFVTENRTDFENLYAALGNRSEPVDLPDSVRSQLVSGLNDWTRVRRYRERWKRENDNDPFGSGWSREMKRVAREEPEQFRDRLMLVQKSPYSGQSASDLGLDCTEEEWLERSLEWRIEHEFTHYATKRLYGSMHKNLWDELIADYAGSLEALGEFRADWFLRCMGIHPDGKATSPRFEEYTGELSGEVSEVARVVMAPAARSLERLVRGTWSERSRYEVVLALTLGDVTTLFGEETELLEEVMDRAGRLVNSS